MKPKVVPKVISAIPKPCGGRVRAKDQMAIMRVFLTPLLVWKKNNLAFFYNRIGSYDFTKKNIPNRIKPLDREYTKSFCFHKINTQNIQESFIVDLGVISNKINELIAAVNELRENHE